MANVPYPEDIYGFFRFNFYIVCDWLQVQSLTCPSVDELSRTLESCRPNFVYLRGEQLANAEVGSLRLSDANLSTPEAISDLFGSILPTMVCGFMILLLRCS